jgi:hypothetical protein
MSEYIIHPEKKDQPSGTFLMDALHRYGFPVEISLKGSDQNWERVRFSEPGPPEAECFVSFEPKDGSISVTVPLDSPHRTRDMQMFLVHILLKTLGGQADHSGTRERSTPEEFAKKIRHLQSGASLWDYFWLVFPWVVVVFGVLALFWIPPSLRHMDLAIAAVSLLCALGLTYSHFKR